MTHNPLSKAGMSAIEAVMYECGQLPPRYPLPAKIGTVYFDTEPGFECVIINDCDERFDPRYVAFPDYGRSVYRRFRMVMLELYPHWTCDQPNDSPNYR